MNRWSLLLLVLVVSLGVGAVQAQTPPPANPATPGLSLQDAADKGDLATVMALVGKGEPINGVAGRYKYTALMNATSSGHVDVVRYLATMGAALDQGDSEGSTALLHACNDNQTQTALALLQAGASPNVGSHFRRFPLMYAAQKGNDAIISALIAAKADLNANCSEGPAAYWAAFSNHPSSLKLIIDAGADPHIRPPGGPDVKKMQYTLLGVAAHSNSVEMIDLLLAHGCDVNAATKSGDTPLMNAAQNGAADAISHLFIKGANVDARNNRGMTAVMVLVTEKPDSGKQALEALIDCHANIEIKDNDGRTPLIAACIAGETNLAQILVLHGADINATDNTGKTAMAYAGNSGSFSIVELLQNHGSKPVAIHIIPKPGPVPPMPIHHLWALSVGAMYTQKFDLDLQVLGGGMAPGVRANSKATLRGSWGITNRATLLKQIDDLMNSGMRAEFLKGGSQLAAMPSDDFQKVLAAKPQSAVQLKAMRESYLVWKDRSGLAWDLCRASMLANQGVTAGYIHDKEAWILLMPIARKVQTSFSSWKEMADNFLDAREIWDNDHDPRMRDCTELLLDPNEPNSPWNHLPWTTDLSAL